MARLLRLTASLCAALLLSSCFATSNDGGLPLPNFGDTIDPVIAVSGIANGATVSGTVALSAAATDNVGLTAFTLRIDGTEVASAPLGALAYSWVTTGATNAVHTLLFSASDAAGNVAETTISATVNNAGGGGGGTSSVSGTVFAPNGVDPVSGALVFVVDDGVSAVGDPPTEPYEAFAYSGANGVFSLTGVPTGLQQLKFIKGAFTKLLSYDVQEGENVLSSLQTTLPSDATGGAGDMLVVTGDYDVIENVLAKLGLATVDGFGLITLGTETFELVDGNNSLADGDYANFMPFFDDGTDYADFRTIFLNCGIDTAHEDAFFGNATAMNALKAWVENGGRLYCTDWSYNFIEQLWPERIDFEAVLGDSDGLVTTPEERDFAKTGESITTLNCHIEDSALAAWMTALGASTAGDLFETVDWLPAWVEMDAVAGSVKTWATGTPPADVLRPMTVTFSVGDGKVLFSSYHTEETPSTDIRPQERVLQYLIFEEL